MDFVSKSLKLKNCKFIETKGKQGFEWDHENSMSHKLRTMDDNADFDPGKGEKGFFF